MKYLLQMETGKGGRGSIGVIRDLLATISANLITLAVSGIAIIMLPKILDSKGVEYGYYQIYMFYISYIGVFNLGLPEGLYLRYGGKKYCTLDFSEISAQFRIFILLQVLLAIVVYFIASAMVVNQRMHFIVIMFCVSMLVTPTRSYIFGIFQSTDRIRDFAKITNFDRILCISFTIIFILSGIRRFEFLILSDVIGRSLSFFVTIYLAKDIAFSSEHIGAKQIWQRLSENLSAGMKILLANFASLFIIGVVRLGIQNKWDISVFGHVSLVISISNLTMVFVRAISIVIYPILKRPGNGDLGMRYVMIRNKLIPALFCLLLIGYPVRRIMEIWIPAYADSLKYIVMLFPICIFESKTSILIETFMKVYRKENWIMWTNLSAVALSTLTMLYSVYLKSNLDYAVLSVVVVLAYRSFLGELLISRYLKVSVMRQALTEILMCAIFICTGWLVDNLLGYIIYVAALALYLVSVMIENRKRVMINGEVYQR